MWVGVSGRKRGNSVFPYRIEFVYYWLNVWCTFCEASSNACAQKPESRHDDGQRILTWQQSVMRQVYAEIAERGLGLLQRFVSAFSD